MSAMSTEGLTLEQAPPLSVPMSFFLTAPVGIVAAGAVLLGEADAALSSTWSPLNAAAAHLLTVGFLLAVMIGAMYQMAPVVAGARVPAVRLAHLTHALLVVGGALLVYAQGGGEPWAFAAAFGALLAALLLFVLPLAVALSRAPTRTHTVTGLRIATGALVLLITLGLWMAFRRAGGRYGEDWVVLRTAHVVVAFIGWLGGLIAAVSWQVVPMFYLTPELPRASRIASLLLVALSAVGAAAVWAAGGSTEQVLWAACGGAAAVWLLHPAMVWRALMGRRRRRVDPSIQLWRLGLLSAPAALAAGVAAAELDSGNWPVLFGWLVLWGWAGSIVHGMLSRIAPFLVWLHRFSALVGLQPTPPMRRILPPWRVTVGLVLHATTLLLGAAAIIDGRAWLARATGAGLVATGLWLALSLSSTLRHRAPAPTAKPGDTAPAAA